MDILKVRSLTKNFDSIMAVSSLDMDIEGGSITALIGPNGAGKTTTFNMITGFLKPDAGRVFFKGQDITGWPAYKVARMGLVRTFQKVEVFGGLSVLDNIKVASLGRTMQGLFRWMLKYSSYVREDKKAVETSLRALEDVGLKDLLDKPARLLTFGQLRLLEIARALATGASMMLLDEPAAGLNSVEVEDLASLMKEIRSRGVTIFLIDHDMKLIMDISDTVIVLDQGARIASGRPEQVRTEPRVIEAYLGT